MNNWIEKSVGELEKMLVNCTSNAKEKLTFGCLSFEDIDYEIFHLLEFWTILAPFKYTKHIEEKANDPFWGKLYREYYGTFSLFSGRKFFIYYEDLYIKPYLTFSEFIPEEERFRGLIWSLIENSNLRIFVKDFKKSDWERLFAIEE